MINEKGNPVPKATVSIVRNPSFHLKPVGFYPGIEQVVVGLSDKNGEFCVDKGRGLSSISVNKGPLHGGIATDEIDREQFEIVLKAHGDTPEFPDMRHYFEEHLRKMSPDE